MIAGRSEEKRKQKKLSLIPRNSLQEWLLLLSMFTVKDCSLVFIAMLEPKPVKGDLEAMDTKV